MSGIRPINGTIFQKKSIRRQTQKETERGRSPMHEETTDISRWLDLLKINLNRFRRLMPSWKK